MLNGAVRKRAVKRIGNNFECRCILRLLRFISGINGFVCKGIKKDGESLPSVSNLLKKADRFLEIRILGGKRIDSCIHLKTSKIQLSS